MKFRVSIRGKDGKTEERVIEAPTRFGVYDQVRTAGDLVTDIQEVGDGLAAHISWLHMTIGRPVKRSVVTGFAKNLSTMLRAGLSLSRALSIIERQASNKQLRTVSAGLQEAIRGGSSFHDALAKYPKVFPGLFISMARAGEESGALAESLSATALQMERVDELIRKVRGAMIYPTIVIVAVIIVAILMLVYVVPTLTATFKSLGVQVPLTTRAIIALSSFMQANAVLVFASLVGLAGGGVVFLHSRVGGAFVVHGALHLPIIGELVRETYTARTARTLASLLTAGVPVLEALTITHDTVTDTFATVIKRAEESVKKGGALSVAFAQNPKLYPILMSDMIAVGEETGKVSDMLRQIAEYYETDVAEKTKDLSTIIEPVLMLLIGAVVGVFAVSMIAPIYQLSSAI